MKRIHVLILLLVIVLPAVGQTNSDGSAPQFLFPDFADGTVKMKNGKSQTTSLNYNIVSERMVYQKDEALYDLINIEMVDTIFLQDSKFVPVGKIFHEILVVGPISLFVQYKGSLIPPGTPAGYGGTSQVSNTKMMTSVQLQSGYYNLKLPEDFQIKSEPVFWMKRDKNFDSFVTERQFLKLFPGKEGELKKFIRENHIKFERMPDLVKLIGHCNETIQ
jgi:hypothetical protein